MKNKKIGILTFSYSSNPGSVLQAYSLQQTIAKTNKYDVNIINYQRTKAGKPVIGQTIFVPPARNWRPKQIIEWCARIVAHPLRMHKYEKFFKKHYIDYSGKPVNREDLPNTDKKYDCFIVGSDQVWNYGSWSVDDTYFLDFVKSGHKKISYAASFGQKGIPEDMLEKAKFFISDFASISVREKYGVDVVSELTGKTAEHVLDPSLLSGKEDYRKLQKTKINKKYVLLYLREDSDELTNAAKKLAKQHNLKLIKIVKHWMYGKNNKPLYAVSPEKWLSYMDSASYVVTNSFHGICFSIIFEKEFFVALLKKVSVATNPRISEIMDLFEIKNRFVDENSDFSDIKPIDYNIVNENKEKLKKYSLDYLFAAIERSVNYNDSNLQKS